MENMSCMQAFLYVQRKSVNILKVEEPYFGTLVMTLSVHTLVIAAVKHAGNCKYGVIFFITFLCCPSFISHHM